MQDEFDRIISFFDLSPEEKDARLGEVFEDSVEYFERFKHIMKEGTPDQQKKAMERVAVLKKKIEEETKRVCEKTGMTPEQLMEYAEDPKNFSPEQWSAISSTKKKLESGLDDAKKDIKSEGSEKTLRKKSKKPKHWMPS